MLNENKLANYSLLIARINLKYKIKVQLKGNVRRMSKCNTHIDINKIMIKMKLGFYIIFFLSLSHLFQTKISNIMKHYKYKSYNNLCYISIIFITTFVLNI